MVVVVMMTVVVATASSLCRGRTAGVAVTSITVAAAAAIARDG